MTSPKTLASMAYHITYITMEEQNLHFETEIALPDAAGRLAVRQAPTLPSERKELREYLVPKEDEPDRSPSA